MCKKALLPIIALSLSLAASGQTKTAVTSKEAKIVDEINLSEQDIGLFKEQTKQKVDEFQQYIVTLGSKEEAAEKRNMAEKEALKLFYKGAQMEISMVQADGTMQKINRPMEKYLARLKSLPYTRVVIRFYDIAYIRDFTKGPDGKYYSTATIIQEFSGFNDDNIIYTDVTKKDIEIIIDIIEDKFFMEKRWKIFLGDIKATETKTTIL
jgi:transcriptional regulator with PAS, ATPase and Fis domain